MNLTVQGQILRRHRGGPFRYPAIVDGFNHLIPVLSMNRQQLRQQMRSARRQLSAKQQRLAAQRLAQKLCRHPLLLHSRRIGLYLANDGEISTQVIIDQLQRRGKQCFLPVLHPIRHNRLWFARYRPDTPLRYNGYGIAEPDIRHTQRVQPWGLDVVLLPLVAFDAWGGRLGMGGGYYDRTFAYRHRTGKIINRPVLIGLAHELQRVERLSLASWDIPLAAVATDQHIYHTTLTQHPPEQPLSKEHLQNTAATQSVSPQPLIT